MDRWVFRRVEWRAIRRSMRTRMMISWLSKSKRRQRCREEKEQEEETTVLCQRGAKVQELKCCGIAASRAAWHDQ